MLVRIRLKEEREIFARVVRHAEEAGLVGEEDIDNLRSVLTQIEAELISLPAAEPIDESPSTPILPDSHLSLALPSERARFKGSFNEGAPKRPVRHLVE